MSYWYQHLRELDWSFLVREINDTDGLYWYHYLPKLDQSFLVRKTNDTNDIHWYQHEHERNMWK